MTIGSRDGARPHRVTGRAAPLVSIVIPCYNQARYLGEAVQSALDQSVSDTEIIVVNDGSTDDTVRVAGRFPGVRCITQERRGLAAARNSGVAHCSGELVVFLDADDRLLPGGLDAGARLMTADSSLAFVAGFSRFINAEGEPMATEQPVRGGDDPYRALLRRNSIRNPAMVMFRRSAVKAEGGFDSRVNACADYDMYLRLSRHYAVRFHEHVVADYRKHGANMSLDAALMLRQLCTVIRRQRVHAADPETRDAYRAGIRHVREYYGDRLVTQIRSRLRTRSSWRQVLADIAVLLRWHPRGAFVHAWRKFSLLPGELRRRRAPEAGNTTSAVTTPEPDREGGSNPPGTASSGRHRTPTHTPAETPTTPAPGSRLFPERAPGDRTGRG